jgi:hypothetical protein
MGLDEALERVLEEGTREIKEDGLQGHLDALGQALWRVATEPECEVRLTFRTTAQAAAAWSWMIWAVKKMEMFDAEKSSAFDVELTNGSGLMFWTDEGRPEAAPSG